MIDRRVFAAVVVVVVIAFGVRSATTSDTTNETQQATVTSGSLSPSPVTPVAPVAPVVAAADAPISVDVQPTSTSTTLAAPAPAGVVPETIEQEEVRILVDLRRPSIDATEPPEDHHHHDGEFTATGNQPVPGTKQIASTLVVTGWTWRYNDADTRQADALAPVASPAVIAQIAPSTDELQRRAKANEVSWVIIRNITIDGNQATVLFDQHLVTSTTAETVVTRSVVVTTAVGVAFEVAL